MDLTIDQIIQLIGRQAIAIESLTLQLKAAQSQTQAFSRERDSALAESYRLRERIRKLEAELGTEAGPGTLGNMEIGKQENL